MERLWRQLDLLAFQKNVTALINAGTRGGDTGLALRNAAEFEAEIDRLKRSSGGGLWGGILSFLFAYGLIVSTHFYFGPMLMNSDIMGAGDAEGVQWASTIAEFSVWSMSFLMFGFLMLIFTSSVLKRFLPVLADGIILKVPFYRELVLSRNNFMVLYGLSKLIRSAVPMEQSLMLSAEGSPPGILKSDLLKAAEFCRKGKDWADALSSFHPTDRASLATSLDRKMIANVLDALSEQYRAIYAQRLAAANPILRVISVIFLMLAGIVIFGQTMIPMLQFSL